MELTGRWKEAPRLMGEVSRDLDQQAEQLLEALGKAVSKNLRNAILGNASEISLRFRKLRPSTLSKKKTDQTLVETQEYAKSISYELRPSSQNIAGGMFVTIDNVPTRLDSYVSNPQLARFFEYGTRNMRPLPHWRQAKAFGRKWLRENPLTTRGRKARFR